jgi:hypothetical protein
MTSAEDPSERLGAGKRASVRARVVRINDVDSSCRRKHPCAHPAGRMESRRALGPRGDFRYYLDSRGCQHFNFEQRIWLKPSVQMAVTPVMTMALETLALNLLTHIFDGCGDTGRLHVASKDLLRFAKRFSTECLLTACPEGWVIPRNTIEEWLASKWSPVSSASDRVPTARRGNASPLGKTYPRWRAK